MREEVFGYIQKKYKAKPEYLWAKFPEYAIFRHADNQKWFGLVMNISYDKINKDKSGMVDILNVKLDDILLRDVLVQQDGYYVGAPVSAILYQCKVIEVDIPYDHHSSELTITKLMKIKLIKRYKPEQFTFERLKSEYGIFAVRGPRGVPNRLSAALKGK